MPKNDDGSTMEQELEMANGCLSMIQEVLEQHINMDGCCAMFYPEAIHNCIAMPKRAIMRATGAEEKTVGNATEDELVKIIRHAMLVRGTDDITEIA